jgi:hypothetical protein
MSSAKAAKAITTVSTSVAPNAAAGAEAEGRAFAVAARAPAGSVPLGLRRPPILAKGPGRPEG